MEEIYYKILTPSWRSEESWCEYGWKSGAPHKRDGAWVPGVTVEAHGDHGFHLVRRGELCSEVEESACLIFSARGEDAEAVYRAAPPAPTAFHRVTLLRPVSAPCLMAEWESASLCDALRIAALVSFDNWGDEWHRKLVRVACEVLRETGREDLDDRLPWLIALERWGLGRSNADDAKRLLFGYNSGPSLPTANDLFWADTPFAAACAIRDLARTTFAGLAAVKCGSATTEEAEENLARVKAAALARVKAAYPCWTGYQDFSPVHPDKWGLPYCSEC